MDLKKTKEFWQQVYEARYFWSHLARMDLKNKFRRSKLGILWVCVTPMCLMAIMTVIFGVAFHEETKSYAPYILSGLLVWAIFTDSFVAGWQSIVGNEPYIRQYNHPIAIYPLKAAVASIVSFTISLASLVVLEIINLNFFNIVIGIASLPFTLIIYFIFDWSATIIAAYLGTRYRDYPNLASLALQAVWYVSPVFIQESAFESNEYLYKFFQMNPLTHFLNLIRKPFLYGTFPSLENYLVSILMVAIVTFFAYRLNKKNQRDIIFYI